MQFQRIGSFLIPRGTSQDDLGGKAQRLIENEELARKNGFEFPNAVALPWQTFAGLAARKGITAADLAQHNFYAEFKAPDFSEIERQVIKDVLSIIVDPFFSSSAPGEDSFIARMSGIYESRRGRSLADFRLNEQRDMGVPEEEDWLNINLDKVGDVVSSYYTDFAAGVRDKHGIPHTGMGVLLREVVGGATGPSYSMVIQTDHSSVNVGVIERWGDSLVSGKGGRHFKYHPADKSFNQPHDYPFDLQRIVEQTLSFEAGRNLPENYGGDYEMALDAQFTPYLLQCPPLLKQKDIGKLPRKGNLLTVARAIRGNVDMPLEQVVFIDRNLQTYSPLIEQLFRVNRELNDYLLITRGMPKVKVPSCAYNAAGIIEFLTSTTDLGPHGEAPVSHYSTLLRTERIGFVNAVLSSQFLKKLRQAGSGEIKILQMPLQLRINEIRNEAGLYQR